jgi:outer membrane receptor for ferrienterochelin and colicin
MNNLLNIALFLRPVVKKILLLLFLIPFAVKSQTDSLLLKKDSIDIYDMSIDELIKLKAHGVPSEMESLINSLISVASKKPLNVRESPSVITLITEEEIKNSGARDLIDVLRLVPGINFGVDIEGVVGIGMRGNWAIEGKVLVLLDGQELNETVTGTVTFGNRYAVEHIKRIEIIRGPGSAIYGGYAEYGVINIITKQAEDLNGINITTTYGQMEKDYGRKNLSISAGKRINDLRISFSGFLGRGQRSDQIYKDYYGDSYSMAGNSSLNSSFANIAVSYKGLSLRAIGDYYNCIIRDGYGEVIKQGPVKTSFNNLFSELKYVKDLNKKLNLSARVNYKNQSPWKSNGYDFDLPYFVTSTRIFQNVSLNYNSSRKLNFVFGSECYQDYAIDRMKSGYFSNGGNNKNFQNYAGFFQGQLKLQPINLIFGTRFDSHSEFGNALVPRVGLTKKYDKFHYKILFSRAFKSPTIDNINFADSKGIKPEYTNVYEAEIGYKINKNSFFSINAYDISTTQAIVYYTSKDSSNTDFYSNFGYTGTKGIELEYRFKEKWGYFNLNYAYYSSTNKSSVDVYSTPESKSLLAFANHRVNLNTGININKNLSLNSTASYYGKRWFVSGIDSAGNSIKEKMDPLLLLNFFIRYQTPIKGFNVGLGVYDALNSKLNFIQPYDGGHAPLPGPSREFIIRLDYTLNYK